MKTKCISCKKPVEQTDNECPHCGSDLKKQRKTATIGGLSLFAAVFIGFFWMCSGDHKSTGYDKTDALIMSRTFVKRNLKAPSTAEFDSNLTGVSKINDSTFTVNSYVDSQNGFGAMIRSNYMVKLYFDKEGTAYLIDLKIN